MRNFINIVENHHYPMAPRGEWYGNGTYAENGGEIVMMSPDEYLSQVRPLEIDDVSRENIDDLKQHIESGRTLDPLVIYPDGKEDGRHRAHAAKELGIKEVPVIVFRKTVIDDAIVSETTIPKRITNKVIRAALDAMERDSYSSDEDTKDRADRAFSNFTKKTIPRDEILYYYEREQEYQSLQ